jgi:GNAT superfamily N-acetyltransferase
MLHEDIDGVIALQRACFPEPFPQDALWQRHHLEAHLANMAGCQFVADIDRLIVGSASACRIPNETWDAHQPWEQTLGGFVFEAGDPHGQTLYGADISVHPDFRGRGVARLLYQARFDFVRENNMDRYGTACRIPDCQASGLDPSSFAQAVSNGTLTDRTMTPLLRMGLTYLGVIENYMEDEESLDAAALLEWRPS